MTHKFDEVWFDVRGELDTAKGIAFDGCHKIYVLKDDQQVKQSAEWGYGEDGSFLVTDLNADEMLTLIKDWYNKSCGLKFVESVETVEGDPNEGYLNIIPQGYESEFCLLCGEYGTDNDGYCSDCCEDEDEDDEDGE